MSDTCAKTVKIACPDQQPFDLTYPDCDAAKVAKFRLSKSAKKCEVNLAGAAPRKRRNKKAK